MTAADSMGRDSMGMVRSKTSSTVETLSRPGVRLRCTVRAFRPTVVLPDSGRRRARSGLHDRLLLTLSGSLDALGRLRASLLPSPVRVVRCQLRHPLHRRAHVPALVSIDRDPDFGADDVAGQVQPPYVVGEAHADLERDLSEPVGDGLPSQLVQLGV